MSFRFFYFLIVFCVSLPAWSLSFNWSGWSRVESYYQNTKEEDNYYAGYHLVLKPKIHILDGLSLSSRLELKSLGESFFQSSEVKQQSGVIFLYAENSEKRDLKFPDLYLGLSQIYMDYSNEFFRIRLGRAPYHFGMGITYSASTDPFQHWISIYNQMALYLEYSRFYFQPVILHKEGQGIAALAQAGFSHVNWQLSALYQNDFKNTTFIEAFTSYKQSYWEVKASSSYFLLDEINMLWALEAFLQVPAKIPFEWAVKAGGAVGEASFHPNYGVALIFANRKIRTQTPSSPNSPFKIVEAYMPSGHYFSSELLFSFVQDQLKLKPLFLIFRDSQEKSFNYEFDLEMKYHWDKSLFLVLQGGVFYDKSPHWALLAQAAVSF